jgi:tetratricopeptide (TPR) repeat protein
MELTILSELNKRIRSSLSSTDLKSLIDSNNSYPSFGEEVDNYGFSWVPSIEDLKSAHTDKNYLDYLKNDSSFFNPSNIQLMSSAYNIIPYDSNILVDNSISPDWNISTLNEERTVAMSTVIAAHGVRICREGDYAKAIEEFNRSLELYPQNVEALVGKGAALANLGELHRAVHYFQNALVIDSEHANAKIYLEKTYSKIEAAKEIALKDPEINKNDTSINDYNNSDKKRKSEDDRHIQNSSNNNSRHKHRKHKSENKEKKHSSSKKKKKKHKHKHVSRSGSKSSSSSSSEEDVHPILQRQKNKLWDNY